ncbi:MAG: hypothetical protein V3U92_19690 [Cellulophaga sp.]
MPRKALFEGEYYRVYAKKGTSTRTIFPKMAGKFKNAPFGAQFPVAYGGILWYANKGAQYQENRARVPVLTWTIGL